MLKLADNPPTLHPATIASLRALPRTWAVAHTKARNEKAFAWDLVNRDIPYFLPMMQRVRFSGGRRRRVLLPLFPSYVFICGDPSTRIADIRNVVTVFKQGVGYDPAKLIDSVTGRVGLF